MCTSLENSRGWNCHYIDEKNKHHDLQYKNLLIDKWLNTWTLHILPLFHSIKFTKSLRLYLILLEEIFWRQIRWQNDSNFYKSKIIFNFKLYHHQTSYPLLDIKNTNEIVNRSCTRKEKRINGLCRLSVRNSDEGKKIRSIERGKLDQLVVLLYSIVTKKESERERERIEKITIENEISRGPVSRNF